MLRPYILRLGEEERGHAEGPEPPIRAPLRTISSQGAQRDGRHREDQVVAPSGEACRPRAFEVYRKDGPPIAFQIEGDESWSFEERIAHSAPERKEVEQRKTLREIGGKSLLKE